MKAFSSSSGEQFILLALSTPSRSPRRCHLRHRTATRGLAPSDNVAARLAGPSCDSGGAGGDGLPLPDAGPHHARPRPRGAATRAAGGRLPTSRRRRRRRRRRRDSAGGQAAVLAGGNGPLHGPRGAHALSRCSAGMHSGGGTPPPAKRRKLASGGASGRDQPLLRAALCDDCDPSQDTACLLPESSWAACCNALTLTFVRNLSAVRPDLRVLTFWRRLTNTPPGPGAGDQGRGDIDIVSQNSFRVTSAAHCPR
jgi:hypothetical protein